MNITWRVFCDHVEKELRDMGIDSNDPKLEIEYIDFSWVDDAEELNVSVDGSMLTISG